MICDFPAACNFQMPLLIDEHHFVYTALPCPFHFYFLAHDRIYCAAHIIRLHGQFPAEMPVYKREQLYLRRPAEIQQGIHCGTYGAACMQHIIDQDHVFARYREGYFRGCGDVQRVALVHIIAVKSNIELAVEQVLVAGNLLYDLHNTVGQEDSSWLYADDHRIRKRKMILYQLMRKALQGNIELRRI